MSILRSLWVKVAVGFVLVALAAVGLVGVLANRATTQQFEVYVSQGRQLRALRLTPQFADYYTQTGSWAGVEAWMSSLVTEPVGGRGQGRGYGTGTGATADRLLLAEPHGEVLADSMGILGGEMLSAQELAFGVPVEVEGNQVATLLLTAPGDLHQTLEAQFIQDVNHSLWLAGISAVGLALLAGLLLARQLTAPLRALTEAAQRLTRGKGEPASAGPVPQVQVCSEDEIGELAEAFNQMAQSLAHQETLRRNLMADIAHELRTPLSVIRSDVEALLDGVYDPSLENLASLHEETLLLSRLVDDLRALAQAEAGQLRLEPNPSELPALLERVLAGVEGTANAQKQALYLDLPADLPLVDADPQRVRQILANLVSNALRHAADCGQIRISAAPRDGMVQISVVDNGPGISPQDLPHVFDRFWRGSTPRAEGSGLGLAIARELVRAHGGEIWAESEPGQGAAFHFTLPQAQAG
jgi:signal transduction histidine kinase